MQPNDRIGDYEIICELGRGGMGRVFKVRNTISDRIEAMKILLPELAGRQELVARFLREIKLVASLNHPNIGALRTALTLNDQLIMIMEFVEGTSLADYLDNGPLPVGDAMAYMDQVLQALSHAHARGVVHRDIKPANMMLTPDGTVKVMDFGIAFSGTEHKLTQTGTTLGSLAYMSPEQVRGEMADPRSDLYSLGISLYEMVTGTRPFKGDSDFAIMAAHVKESPRPPMELQPGLPEGLNRIILMSIEKEKEHRFQSADAFRAALASVGPIAASAGARNAPRTAAYVASPMTPTPAPPKATGTMISHPSAPSMPASYAAEPAVPQARQGGGNRGLYMGIGAVLAIAVLVAAGTYYSSSATGSAQVPPAPSSSAAPTASAPSASAPQTAPDAATATPPAAAGASAGSTSAPASAPASSLAPSSSGSSVASDSKKQPAPQSAPAPAELQAAPAEKPKAPDNSAALEELETQIDQLTIRALAVDSSLETLRRQQRAQGLDLRADMSARQESMKLNLAKAREAFEKGDHIRGKRFADLTETALGALEKFIGR